MPLILWWAKAASSITTVTTVTASASGAQGGQTSNVAAVLTFVANVQAAQGSQTTDVQVSISATTTISARSKWNRPFNNVMENFQGPTKLPKPKDIQVVFVPTLHKGKKPKRITGTIKAGSMGGTALCSGRVDLSRLQYAEEMSKRKHLDTLMQVAIEEDEDDDDALLLAL